LISACYDGGYSGEALLPSAFANGWEVGCALGLQILQSKLAPSKVYLDDDERPGVESFRSRIRDRPVYVDVEENRLLNDRTMMMMRPGVHVNDDEIRWLDGYDDSQVVYDRGLR
jgi:hypothetical protein